MLLLVDNTIEGVGASPREIRAALQKIEPDLRVVTEPFKNITPEFVKVLSPSHIILSGQSHPWDKYPTEDLAGVFHVIRESRQPILGVCGGHQQMALAFGARVDLIERLAPGAGYEGAFRERGFCVVDSESADGIFAGLPKPLTVWESHCDEVKQLPADFVRTATNQVSDIQAMQHPSLPLFGVQFHPELFDDEHPHGRKILENFLSI
ncbi:MAG TPA: gamma-glutamyl-gamma-aminobutyrate hydrolase family protein [Pyrinomonadaceae bacterium]|jgi:GMP synthase (glutamine-hydrolysing)|nr:gamma-glutamyl-gamma-aminobutyrate hydrolase family protein [Pyrinomonadaceae bacterium]